MNLKYLTDKEIIIYDGENENYFVIENNFDNGIINIDLCVEGLDSYYDIIKILKENSEFEKLSLSGITDMELKFSFKNIDFNLCYAELLDGVIFIRLNKNEISNYEENKMIYRLVALNLHKTVKKMQEINAGIGDENKNLNK